MKLQEQQKKLEELLKETITLLCKSGLKYQNSFCVDAVIGVTLDDNHGFYMTIKDYVENVEQKTSKRKKSDLELLVNSCSDSDDGFELQTHHLKQKTKPTGNLYEEDHNDLISSPKKRRTVYDSFNNSLSNIDSSYGEDLKKTFKPEPDDGEDDELVIIKTEQSDSDVSYVTEQHQNLVQQLTDFSSPVNAQAVGEMAWAHTLTSQTVGSGEQMHLDSGQMNFSGQKVHDAPQQSSAGIQPSPITNQHQPESPYVCSICCNIYRRKQSLKDHLRAQHGLGTPFICGKCGTICNSRGGLQYHERKGCSISSNNGPSHQN